MKTIRNEPASSPVGIAPSADVLPDGLRDSPRGDRQLTRRSLLIGGASLALTAGQPLSAATTASQAQPPLDQAMSTDVRPQTLGQLPTQVQEKGVRPQTLAEGNLYIPRAIREVKISINMKNVTKDVVLKELFRQAKAPYRLIGDISKHITGWETHGEGITFGDCLSRMLAYRYNCRIENGVYVVYPLEKNIVPGRPDLDHRLFKRNPESEPPTAAQIAALEAAKAAHPERLYHVMDLPKLRPILDSLFAEAGLQHQVRDDVSERCYGFDIDCDFRSAIYAVIDSASPPITFEVRDGVYCFYPRPTY